MGTDRRPLYGTLHGGTLTLNVPQSDGSMQAATCNQGSLSDWNKAVAALDSQAGQESSSDGRQGHHVDHQGIDRVLRFT